MKPLDHARGFRCPSCQAGDIFLDVSGPVAVATALGACSHCGFLPDQTQVDHLSTQESRIEDMVLEWDRRAADVNPNLYLTDALVHRLQENLTGLLSERHWLVEKVGRYLALYFETTHRAERSLPFAERFLAFIADSYPGVSPIYAWSLEHRADLMLIIEGLQPTLEDVGQPTGITTEAIARLYREVGPIYIEAARMLKTLFGPGHEYYTTMTSKIKCFARAAQTEALI